MRPRHSRQVTIVSAGTVADSGLMTRCAVDPLGYALTRGWIAFVEKQRMRRCVGPTRQVLARLPVVTTTVHQLGPQFDTPT